MDEYLVMALIRDVETSMKILAIAVKEGNFRLAEEAINNAENELESIRRMIQEPPTRERRQK